jgi:hypothetical protein
LPEVAYDVVKLHHRLHREAERRLRLTRNGIENVRMNGKTTTLYPYSAIRSVALKNLNTLVIRYDGGKPAATRATV